MTLQQISPAETRELGPVELDREALKEMAKAIAGVGRLDCRVRDARNLWFSLSKPEDFDELGEKATVELKYVSMCAIQPRDKEPALSVELCRERAQLRHSAESGEVLRAAQQVTAVCRSRTRRVTRFVLKHTLVGHGFVVLLSAAAGLLVSAVANVSFNWWLVPVTVLATMILVPSFKLALGRILSHAYIYNSPVRDRPGFFRRNKDNLIVTLLGAVAVTALAVLVKLL